MQDFDVYLNDYEMFGAIDPEFNSIVPTLASVYLVILALPCFSHRLYVVARHCPAPHGGAG